MKNGLKMEIEKKIDELTIIYKLVENKKNNNIKVFKYF